jgi:hypothetical protein
MAKFGGRCINFFGQTKGVNGMDIIADLQRLLDLVSLEMTDHMPADLFGESRIACLLFQKGVNLVGDWFEMLYPVFPQIGTPKPDYFLNSCQGGIFRNNNDLNLVWFPTAAAAGRGYVFLDGLNAFSNRTHSAWS